MVFHNLLSFRIIERRNLLQSLSRSALIVALIVSYLLASGSRLSRINILVTLFGMWYYCFISHLLNIWLSVSLFL